MTFTRRKTAEIAIKYNSKPIEFVKEFKYLRLTIDNKVLVKFSNPYRKYKEKS